MRRLLGVADEESVRDLIGERAFGLRRRGLRAYRSLERFLQGVGIAPPPRDVRPAVPPEATKFDLGTRARDQTPAPVDIPWGYGEDRVTAMAVDPDRLYVYWEVTDEAIAAARHGLGAGGQGAWLNLRVYDVSHRIFDGTNAHSYFDHRVERWDRQWFFTVGKPTATVCVEIGLKSIEGFFVRIARSGRADFPRREPAAQRGVEWLTVRGAGGGFETSRAPAPSHPHAPPSLDHAGPREAPGVERAVVGNGHRVVSGAATASLAVTPGGTRHWRWREVGPGWREVHRTGGWVGDVEHSSWHAGPFSTAIDAPAVVEERFVGPVQVTTSELGTRVVQGPWEMVIRGLSAWAERRVLARWELVRHWTSEPVSGSRVATIDPGATSGSESALLRGASERGQGRASELRLSGASEQYRLGASELRYRGGSETFYAGASERRLGGASERRSGGASEWAFAGASEHVRSGASERLRAGASERRLGGASEGARREGCAAVQPRAATGDATTGSSDSGDRPHPPRW